MELFPLRGGSAKPIWPIVDALCDFVTHSTIPMEIHNGTHWLRDEW